MHVNDEGRTLERVADPLAFLPFPSCGAEPAFSPQIEL